MVNDMSEHKQNLSAYLDDNLSSEEQRALQLDGLGDTAHHYQLIGEAMRGQVSELSLLDVTSQVREAIAHEQIEQPVSTPRAQPAEQKPGLLASLFNFSDWLRPVGGLAIAASVAMIVVVSLQQQGDPQNTVQPQLASQDMPAARATLARVPNPANIVPVSNRPDLSRYLQQHSEFAARDTAQGRMPYVRAVGYKSRP